VNKSLERSKSNIGSHLPVIMERNRSLEHKEISKEMVPKQMLKNLLAKKSPMNKENMDVNKKGHKYHYMPYLNKREALKHLY